MKITENKLFSLLSREDKAALEGRERIYIQKGQSAGTAGFVSFIVKGTVEGQNKNGVILSKISEGGICGMAGLFCGKTGVQTRLVALTDAEILTVSESEIKGYIEKCPAFALEYAAILSEKIRFLSSRVCDFSSENVNERVGEYLKKKKETSCPMTELSRRLGIGRASLYRALNELESGGVIKKDGKTIKYIKTEERK